MERTSRVGNMRFPVFSVGGNGLIRRYCMRFWRRKRRERYFFEGRWLFWRMGHIFLSCPYIWLLKTLRTGRRAGVSCAACKTPRRKFPRFGNPGLPAAIASETENRLLPFRCESRRRWRRRRLPHSLFPDRGGGNIQRRLPPKLPYSISSAQTLRYLTGFWWFCSLIAAGSSFSASAR